MPAQSTSQRYHRLKVFSSYALQRPRFRNVARPGTINKSTNHSFKNFRKGWLNFRFDSTLISSDIGSSGQSSAELFYDNFTLLKMSRYRYFDPIPSKTVRTIG